MTRLRTVFFGTSPFAVPTLEKLFEDTDIELVAVITQPDRPAGRGKKLTPPPVKKRALELGLDGKIFQPERIRNEEFYNFFRSLNPDVAVVVAYGKLIPKEVFDFPKYKTLNLHASLLPKYRGAAPIHRAIMAGERETGNSVMLIDEGLDSGPVLAFEREPILEEDNIITLSERLAKKGANLLLKTLKRWVSGKIEPIPQRDEEATYAPPILKGEYRICWKAEAESVRDRIRALYPNAYTTFNGKRIKILSAKVTDIKSDLPPGSVYPFNRDGLYVVCGDQKVLKVEELINPKGKKVKGEDFIRGYRVERFT
ncbi:MAG TPA: methionyl-tRNA formyltransferase [Aquificales bacterium]|nr:methionyl-tRNA formyltransferase [Aquificales bacterium]